MKARSEFTWLLLPIIFFSFLIGCSGSGGGGDDPVASIEVSPSSHNFGVVTVNNFSAPLEVKINNKGSSDLVISNITSTDQNNFNLDENGGSNPCNSTAPTLNPGESCTVEVEFLPTALGAYTSELRIRSNAANSSVFDLVMTGEYEAVDALVVKINQVDKDRCPDITTYLSVIDQGGFAVTGLQEQNFSVTEAGDPKTITDFAFVSQVLSPISVAVAMDYSGSIVDFTEIQEDMEEAVDAFVDQIGTEDEVEIIKFGETVEVFQAFTSDKAALRDAIFRATDLRGGTRLYDAAYKAVEDFTAARNSRNAVILLTDGVDIGPDGKPLSDRTLAEVIDFANSSGVPIFTIALGDFSQDPLRQQGLDILRQMAADTGGISFDAPSSENLKTIYQQLVSVLFENQYIIDYTTAVTGGADVELTVQATQQQPALTGQDTKTYQACP